MKIILIKGVQMSKISKSKQNLEKIIYRTIIMIKELIKEV